MDAGIDVEAIHFVSREQASDRIVLFDQSDLVPFLEQFDAGVKTGDAPTDDYHVAFHALFINHPCMSGDIKDDVRERKRPGSGVLILFQWASSGSIP